MQKISTTQRLEWIDFAKGVVIIFMVLGHAISNGVLQKFIFVFHMPFFFVMAGFLLNFDKWGGAENFRPFVTKLFWRLLVPYYLAEILWYPIWFVVCHEFGFLNHMNHWAEIEPLKSLTAIFLGNGNVNDLILGQLWFLPTLFVSEIIFIKLHNRFAKIDGAVFALAAVILACLGFNLRNLNIILPLGIDIALVTQIFLLTGILVRRYKFVDRMNWKIIVALTVILVWSFFFNEHVDMNFRRYGNFLLFYAGGISGTLLVMKISMLAAKVGGKICALIEDCGRQSIMILVLHLIIAKIFYDVIVRVANFPPEKLSTEPTIIFFTTILGTLIPLFVAKKFGRLPVLKIFCA